MSNGESKDFYEFLLNHFDDGFRVLLMQCADKWKVDIKEAMEIAVKDSAREGNIMLTELSKFQIKLIRKHVKKRITTDKFVNNMINEMFTGLKLDGTIGDSKPISKAELRSRMK